MGRLAPRASVTLGRIQAISAGKSPLFNCHKAMISLEKDCSYENSNSHSLTAPPTSQFQYSILSYSPRFPPTQPTYCRCAKKWRVQAYQRGTFLRLIGSDSDWLESNPYNVGPIFHLGNLEAQRVAR